MKTRCPECQTVFRVTPEQLKARAGKVRCGHCRRVFNALESLFEKTSAVSPPAAAIPTIPSEREIAKDSPAPAETPVEARAAEPASREIPGDEEKWAEEFMAPGVDILAEKPARWPFLLVIVALALGLAGQALFHFRGELAIAAPALRPALESFSFALGYPLPLPRHVEWVSIETSDLQIDSARGRLLVFNATLRNKASYGQAYPWLELSLTNTQNVDIARRTFGPGEYLPMQLVSGSAFQAYSDIPVRLWIEAVGLQAAGYRLRVFYP